MNSGYTALNIFSLDRGRHIVSIFLVVLLTTVLLVSLISTQVFADESASSTKNIVTSELPLSNPGADILSGIVSLSPKSSAKQFLDVNKASRKENAQLITTTKKTGTGQRFQIRKSGDNTYIIRSADTGRLVTETNGKIVQTGMTVATDNSQLWTIVKNGDDYIFTNVATENKLSVKDGMAVPATKNSGVSNSQAFRVSSSPIRLDGYYILHTANGNAIAMDKVSLKDKAKVTLKKKAQDTIGIKFFFTSSSNGYHEAKNSISFKALSVKGNSGADGAGIVLNNYNKKRGQRFKLVPSDDGWYFLKTASGKYISAASDQPGKKIMTTNDTAKALKLQVESSDYSTSIPKLDANIKKIRKKIGNTATMKKCYQYVINHYKFRNHPNDFSGDWISRYALYMTSGGTGHCKNFAATLCVLYRSYGYDARVVTGYVPSASRGWVVHGWVEMGINGKTYVFDPDLQYELGGVNFYKRTYANAPCAYRIEKRW